MLLYQRVWFPKFKIFSDFSRPYLINLRLRHRLPTLVAHQGFRAGDRGPKSPGAGLFPADPGLSLRQGPALRTARGRLQGRAGAGRSHTLHGAGVFEWWGKG